MRIFHNGVLFHRGAGHVRSPAGITSDLFVGANTAGLENYDGLIDEFRVSSVDRSANWICATYLTAASNDTSVPMRS